MTKYEPCGHDAPPSAEPGACPRCAHAARTFEMLMCKELAVAGLATPFSEHVRLNGRWTTVPLTSEPTHETYPETFWKPADDYLAPERFWSELSRDSGEG